MWTDMSNALAFLTIMPVHFRSTSPVGRLLAWAPLVGLLIGVLVSATALLPLQRELRAFIVVAIWVSITGGLHLDGFADSCDGLLATVDVERRLEIMRDPRAGSWAVIGLILLLLGKWSALLDSVPATLILVPVVGRWAIVLTVYAFKPARQSGAAVHFREGFGRAQLSIATMTTLLVGVILGLWAGWVVVVPLLTAPLCVWLVGGWAARRLSGGLTGDVYGALCELTEVLCLILLALLR
jgi:adenosylcobinamide-GDP ribazoletransferase